MNKQTLLKLALLVSVGSLLSTGCVYHEVGYRERPVVVQPPPPGADVTVTDPAAPGGEVVVTQAPPAPYTEEIAVSPGPAFLWVPGVWVWEGRWVWARGHWARRPHPHAVWVQPHYAYRGGVHVFVRGGWR